MSADVCFTKSECVSRYNRSGPRGAGNTGPGLTHSLDYSKEGLMPNYTQPCTVNGCESLIGRKGARGLCTRHYQRYLSTGSPTGTLRPAPEDRFWRKVDKSSPRGCWEWLGSQDGQGYGLFSLHGVTKRAHRFAYLSLVGPIPAGLVIDHLCRNRLCVNPEHMEPVTNQENLRRGQGHDVSQGRRNTCPAGHTYSPENTYINPRGAKCCRTCSAAARKRYEDRKKSA